MSSEVIMRKKTVEDLQVSGKKVLLRVDFNVPMQGRVITGNRIRQALPTISTCWRIRPG